jgi:NADH-quinone oxidoreductase subunit E
MAAESVEKETKQRKRPITEAGPAEAFKAPELLHGEPIGAAGKEPGAAPVRASASKPSLDDKNRPAGIERPAAVDDLKLISGVGPKIEGTLHSLGIYTFAQVASWKKAERDWVDGYLNFRGRIERDDWVKQAKALAKGGVAEYIRVFGKKPV